MRCQRRGMQLVKQRTAWKFIKNSTFMNFNFCDIDEFFPSFGFIINSNFLFLSPNCPVDYMNNAYVAACNHFNSLKALPCHISYLS